MPMNLKRIPPDIEHGVKSIIDAMPFYVLLVDDEHRIILANKQIQREFNLDPDAVKGEYCPKAIHGLDGPFPGCPLEEAVEKGAAVEREIFDKGTNRWMQSVIYPTTINTIEGRKAYLHTARDITPIKVADETLRKNEAEFRSLFEEAPVSLWEEDFSRAKEYLDDLKLNGVKDIPCYLSEHPDIVGHLISLIKVINVNKRTVNMLKAANKEALIANISQTSTKEVFPTTKEEFVAISQGATSFVAETTIKRFDGETLYVLLKWSVAAGSEETYSKVFLSTIDLTDVKKAEEEIRFQAQLLGAATDSIFVHDADGNFSYVNEAAYKTRGYSSQDELLKTNLHDLDVPEYAALIEPRIKELMKTGETTFESAHFRKDGSTIPVELHVRALDRASGGLFLSVARDISQRKKADTALRESEELFRALVDTAPDAVILVNINGNIMYVSKKALKLYGSKDEKNLIGKNILELIAPEDRKRASQDIEKTLKHGVVDDVEYIFQKKNGTTFFGEISSTLIESEHGKPSAFMSIIRDITARKKNELETKHSYDIQNVLNSLLSISLKDIHLEQILHQALELILSIPWLVFESRGAIFLVEDDEDALVMKAQSNLSETIQKKCSTVPFGVCICGIAAASKKLQFVDHIDERHVVTYKNMKPHGHYCVPIVYLEKTLGVIDIYLKEGHKRDKREEDFLKAVADTLAGIIMRKRANDDLERSLDTLEKTIDGTIKAMAFTVETRDPYTAGHQERVTELVLAIAEEMGRPEEELIGDRVAATVHDMGKIIVPAEILSKPGKLTDLEFDLIKEHSQAGFDILKSIEFPWPVAKIVLQHHERLNGSGYPQGLKNREIMFEARILAVADVVEAMASHRPYRPARGIEKALDEIAKNKGILYDNDVVDACLAVFNKGFEFSRP